MLLVSMVIYGSIGLFRRWIPLSSDVLACYRGASGALVLLAVTAALRGKRKTEKTGRRKALWLYVSGAVMGFNWILLFEAYNYTTVAVATLCYYMAPTIVVLLSPLIFRERITLRKGLCAAASVGGMILVSGVVGNGIPGPGDARGILFGLGAAVLYAVVVVINKKVEGVDAYRKTIIQLAAAAVSLVPYILLTGGKVNTALTPENWIMLLIVGVVHTGLAYALYFGSLERLQAQTVAVFSYLDPITALLLSALALGERLEPACLAGAALIIGSAIVSVLGDRED